MGRKPVTNDVIPKRIACFGCDGRGWIAARSDADLEAYGGSQCERCGGAGKVDAPVSEAPRTPQATEYHVVDQRGASAAPYGAIFTDLHAAIACWRLVDAKVFAQVMGIVGCGCMARAAFEATRHPGTSQTRRQFRGWQRVEACPAHGPGGSSPHVFAPEGFVGPTDALWAPRWPGPTREGKLDVDLIAWDGKARRR